MEIDKDWVPRRYGRNGVDGDLAVWYLQIFTFFSYKDDKDSYNDMHNDIDNDNNTYPFSW